MDYQMAKIGTKGQPRIDVRTSKRMPDQMEMTNTINVHQLKDFQRKSWKTDNN